MAVVDKITQLTEIRDNIRDALVEQGIEDATTHNYIDFAEDILAIEGGGVTPITITTDTYDMDTTDAYITENAGKFIKNSLIYNVPSHTDSFGMHPGNYYSIPAGTLFWAYDTEPIHLDNSIVDITGGALAINESSFAGRYLPWGTYAQVTGSSTFPMVMWNSRYYNANGVSCTMFKTAQIEDMSEQLFPHELAQGKAAYNNSGSSLYIVDTLTRDDWIDIAIDEADFVANNTIYFQIPVTEDITKTIADVKQVIIYWEGTSNDYSLYYWWDNKLLSSAAAVTGWEELSLYTATPTLAKVGSVLSTASGAARLRPVVISGTAGSPWLALTLGQICFTLKLGNVTWLNRHSNSFKLKVLF